MSMRFIETLPLYLRAVFCRCLAADLDLGVN